ncbi:MAG TPA: CpsD/CapB family tyrosine-protein kinase [Methylomirabilota bacterium]
MSKFTKALEQAQRDRALRAQPPAPAAPTSAPPSPPTPLAPPSPVSPPRTAFTPPTTVPPPTPPPTRRIPVPPRRSSVTVPSEVDGHLVSLVAPAGLEAEQYRALRHVVEQRRKSDNLSVVAISSPGVGDGKTTTAINLAGALAQGADASVLLVEADLRQPAISRLLGFGESARVGLVDAILDPKLTLSDIVLPRPPFNLSVVVAGQTPPSPYEVLKSPRLGTLLEEARRQYDYVVMDTTPLVAVQDCRVVARWVDGIVVVVAANRTPRALLEAALDVLDPAKVVGLVFNGSNQLLSNRYPRYYSAHYAQSSTPGQGAGALQKFSRGIGSLLGRGGRGVPKNPRDRTR